MLNVTWSRGGRIPFLIHQAIAFSSSRTRVSQRGRSGDPEFASQDAHGTASRSTN